MKYSFLFLLIAPVHTTGIQCIRQKVFTIADNLEAYPNFTTSSISDITSITNKTQVELLGSLETKAYSAIGAQTIISPALKPGICFV